MKRPGYTEVHLEFLRSGYRMMHVRDLTKAFNRCFGENKTEGAIATALKRNGFKCGRSPKERLLERTRLFSREQADFIRKNYKGHSVAEMTALFNTTFRTGMTRQQIKTFVHNRGIVSGRTGWFEKGHKPHNKGIKGWQAGGNAVKTQFKPGQRGSKWVPIGSERITKDGILQRKVSDTGYSPNDWRSVHSLMWEKHHGPVPPGHIIVFRDKKNKKIEIENLELITREENMRRNSIHNLPEALVDVIRIRGVLNRRINERAGKNEKQNRRSQKPPVRHH